MIFLYFGTEVALVVRNLFDRLGLKPGDPQLRCIGTSASLYGEKGKEYLQQFFGVARSTFKIAPGKSVLPQAALPRQARRADLMADKTTIARPYAKAAFAEA